MLWVFAKKSISVKSHTNLQAVYNYRYLDNQVTLLLFVRKNIIKIIRIVTRILRRIPTAEFVAYRVTVQN